MFDGPQDYKIEQEEIDELKNQNLGEYNGRPTIEDIKELIIRKRQDGISDRKITVDARYLLELVEYFMTGTCNTYQFYHDAPHQLREYEKRTLEAEKNRSIAIQRVQDVMQENAALYEKMRFVIKAIKQKEATFNKNRIIKLPLARVQTFLAFRKNEDLMNPLLEFYIKIDDKGNMQRIVKSLEEL